MFITVVEVQAFGQVNMHYRIGGSFHPFPGPTHGMSTCILCDGNRCGFHGSFHGRFRGSNFSSQAAFTDPSVAVVFFCETVRERFVLTTKASVKASVEATLRQ